MKKCSFDKKGVCHALACYSSQKCGARDENGNPIYKVIRSEKGA